MGGYSIWELLGEQWLWREGKGRELEWLSKDSGTDIRGLLEEEKLLLQKSLCVHRTDRKCWALRTKSKKSG